MLVHIARIQPHGKEIVYLFLRKLADASYQWFEETAKGEEKGVPILASTAEEGLRLARRHWGKSDLAYRTVNCGFRYTLPERDEHGNNALFYQMAASNTSMNGVYFDPEVGHNCIVNFASKEAYMLWQRLKSANRL